MRNPESISVNEDPLLIPVWSIFVAVTAFAILEYYFWLVLPKTQQHMPPLGLRIYFNLSFGLLVSLYFLMVGYVSKDAPRRAMSSRLWMAICLVMPGGIGAVLYFLLRQPEVSRCPACSTHVQSDFHFCPQCDYRLTANCGHCFRTVRTTDQFCTNCGHELASDHMPARLRVMGE
ncbi:MAG: zinc ribbon domain-containing protein [Terracidiphilus sp.]|jgi:hypothetical protein